MSGIFGNSLEDRYREQELNHYLDTLDDNTCTRCHQNRSKEGMTDGLCDYCIKEIKILKYKRFKH
jgi:hypothetical protein